MNDKYIFSVSVMDIKDAGQQLKKAKYDEDGYTWHVLAVLNHHTENKTFYIPDDFLNQIKNPNGIFYRNLTRGFLYGESNHPKIVKLPDDIPRLLNVEPDRIAVHIRDVKTVPYPGMTGAYLIYGLIRPYGPFGTYLKDGLDSQYINTAFSLRSLVKEYHDKIKDLMMRSIIQLVTFDHVTVPGSYEASKRWSNIGIESYNFEFSTLDFVSLAQKQSLPYKVVGMESSFLEGDLRDLLGAVELKVNNLEIEVGSIYSPNGNIIQPSTGLGSSLIHNVLQTRRGI